MRKRSYFSELIKRRDRVQQRQAHKQMLSDWEAARAALPQVDAEFIRQTREKLKCSRPLFGCS